jgi:hypothetical protein
MDRFIARENIKHFRDRLWSETDTDTRARLQTLLVAEEDKLAADLELLADIDRHIADGDRRMERQQALVTAMERDGHNGLSQARVLLNGMTEGLLLHKRYRQQILIRINENPL